MVKPNSQNARILRALSKGTWVSVAEIHRRAGTSRLNSRISELRKYGYEIEHETVPGKTGALGHRYRLLNPPAEEELVRLFNVHPSEASLDRSSTPRDPDHQYRIYRMVYDDLELVGTAASPEGVGITIVELGRKGVFNGSCLGCLDTFGTDVKTGQWLVSPWDQEP